MFGSERPNSGAKSDRVYADANKIRTCVDAFVNERLAHGQDARDLARGFDGFDRCDTGIVKIGIVRLSDFSHGRGEIRGP